jgi:acyl CoA:acetate/3-ketoacid CoA transferase beta subunit
MAEITAADVTRSEVCIVNLADTWRGDGEILCNPIGNLPLIAGRLARATFEPDLLLTDGEAALIANDVPVGVPDAEIVREHWLPYRSMFDLLWHGKRHVVMGATQVDRYGNQNIACIGDWKQPKSQLLGLRGAPGNTINHPTSYWVPNHGTRVFVEKVDVVSGVGYDRAAALGEQASRFHEIRRVVSNLGVFDFETPDHSMRLRSVHPGVALDEIVDNTAFELVIPEDLDESRLPTEEELRLIREVFDPTDLRAKEIRA